MGFREGPTKTGFKRTSEGPKPEDLRPIPQALDSWSQRALDRVLECSRLLSDSEDPGLVSEGPRIGPRGL